MGILEGGPGVITDAFEEVLSEGTVVIPTFTYSWCRGESFDPKTTECPEMGGYAREAWKDKRFQRTSNANFSVAALRTSGNKKLINQLFQTSNSCFGKNSVFDNMYQLCRDRDGFIILLGGAHNDVVFRTTFIHYVEEKFCVPYRYTKTFSNPKNPADCIKQSARFLSEEEYISVTGEGPRFRHFPIQVNYAHLGLDLEEQGLLQTVPFGYSETRKVPIRRFCDYLEKKFFDDPYYFIPIEKISGETGQTTVSIL